MVCPYCDCVVDELLLVGEKEMCEGCWEDTAFPPFDAGSSWELPEPEPEDE